MSRPDEGMIHAWLDGELDAAEAARIEALVRDDAEWAAAAAEARGFIAASARIVGALDHVPANVIPKSSATTPKVVPIATVRDAKRRAPWWAMRAAALLVIAVGTAVVIRRTPDESGAVNALDQAKVKATTDSVVVPAKATAAAPPATSQPLTSSVSDARKEKDVAGQTRNAPVGPALGAAPRDRLDERRTALADSAAPARPRAADIATSASAGANAAGSGGAVSKLQAELKSSDLKKDAAPAAKANAAVAVTGTVNAVSLETCFRESASLGTASILHRVGRIDDSTALTGDAIGMRAEESGLRARQRLAGAPATAAAMAAAPAAPLTRMKIRGDTLFVSAAGTPARIALKTSCPPK